MAESRPLLPLCVLRECFDLDHATGVLRWRARPASHFKTERAAIAWNAKYQGALAGSPDRHGYLKVSVNNRPYRGHRVVFALFYGIDADRIDHKDGNTLNNRPENLRKATFSQNMANKRTQKNNKSGLKGVQSNHNRFSAFIQSNGKRKYLGSFATALEAHAAYAKAAMDLHGNFARVS